MPTKEQLSDGVLLRRQSGGDGYYLAANEPFTAEKGERAMNIDWLSEDPVTFSVLEALDKDGNSVDVLTLMNIDGIAVSTYVRNFTKWGGFTKVTANLPVWLNLENKL